MPDRVCRRGVHEFYRGCLSVSKAGREIIQEFKKSAVDGIKELDEKRSA